MPGLSASLSLGLSRFRGGAAFTPAALFASGEAGAWYDPSDLSSMNTLSDQTGSTPGVGDPVGYLADKSGNGNHATQATSASRPVLRQTAGGLYYLEFDGVDDFLRSSFGTAVSQPLTNHFAFDDDDSGITVFADGTTSTARGVLLLYDAGDIKAFDAAVSVETTARPIANSVYTTQSNGASSIYRRNGSEIFSGSGGTEGATGITIGANFSDAGLAAMKWFGGIVREALSSSSEISDTESYLAGKSGVTL